MSNVFIKDLIAPVFHPVLRDIKRDGHAEYWLAGGRGSTKSSFISIAIIRGMLRDPRANAIVYRKVAATLRESVYEQMIWAIDKLQLRPYWRFKLSPLELEYRPTGQRILFRGADDPMKSKSIKLAHGYFGFLWFEELAEFAGMDDVKTIKASIIRGGDHAITFYSYNPPKSAQSWVNKEGRVPRKDRLNHASTYLDVPEEWLGESFLQEANIQRETNETAYRHMYLGEITGTGGQVFDNVQLRAVTDADIKSFGTTYAGMDFGWYPDPLHFVRCAYQPATRLLYIYDEYRTLKTSNIDVYRHLRDDKGLTGAEEVIADSADMKSISDMRSYGMHCIAATKGPGSVRSSIRWLQQLRGIVIDPERCPATAKEFTEYECEKTRTGEFVESYPDANNHAIDAVRYAMNRVWLRAGG